MTLSATPCSRFEGRAWQVRSLATVLALFTALPCFGKAKTDASSSSCVGLTPSLSPGFSNYMDKHGLTIAATAGAKPGEGAATTTQSLSGDLAASVTVSRANLGNGYLGIAIGKAGNPNPAVNASVLEDIFYSGGGQIVANVFDPDGSGHHISFSALDHRNQTTFWLERKGNVLKAGDRGASGALATSMSLDGYSVPAVITLFLVLPASDVHAQLGHFSRLDIKFPAVQMHCW